MKCNKCGADLANDMKYCPYCGAIVRKNSSGRKFSDDTNEMTLGLLKLLSTALGASVLLNMKLLNADDVAKDVEDIIEDAVRTKDLFEEQATDSIKEAEKICNDMGATVEKAVSSFSENLESAFSDLGKTLEEVAGRFGEALESAASKTEEKAEEPEEPVKNVEIVFEDEEETPAEETAPETEEMVDEVTEEVTEETVETEEAVEEAIDEINGISIDFNDAVDDVSDAVDTWKEEIEETVEEVTEEAVEEVEKAIPAFDEYEATPSPLNIFFEEETEEETDIAEDVAEEISDITENIEEAIDNIEEAVDIAEDEIEETVEEIEDAATEQEEDFLFKNLFDEIPAPIEETISAEESVPPTGTKSYEELLNDLTEESLGETEDDIRELAFLDGMTENADSFEMKSDEDIFSVPVEEAEDEKPWGATEFETKIAEDDREEPAISETEPEETDDSDVDIPEESFDEGPAAFDMPLPEDIALETADSFAESIDEPEAADVALNLFDEEPVAEQEEEDSRWAFTGLKNLFTDEPLTGDLDAWEQKRETAEADEPEQVEEPLGSPSLFFPEDDCEDEPDEVDIPIEF